MTKLFDNAILRDPQRAMEFITNILESATQISIIGKDIDGKIQLWNEGARRLYGYEPEEVVGSANSSILHTPEDLRDGKPLKMMEAALRDGNWEGSVERVRKDGSRFFASVMLTPRRDASGTPIGFLLMSKDISDQIRLTDELKSTQFYTRSLIESNIDALTTTDPAGTITDVNQQMEALTGYTREELIGSPAKGYFTDPQRAEEGIKLVLQQGTVTNYEMTVRGRDGRQTMVSYNASTFRDADGNLKGVIAAARDITLTKQASQYARSLIESSLDPLVTISPIGKITDVNEATVKVTGVPREQLIGTDFSSYFTDPIRAQEGYKQAFDQGKVTDYALTLRSKTGQLTDVLYNATVYKDDQGNILGVFAAARDVTKSKRAEQLFRGLLESAPDAMVIVDETGTIVLINTETERLFGYERTELLGKSVENLIPERYRAVHPNYRKEYNADPTTRPMERGIDLYGRRKDGAEFPVDVALSPLVTEEGTLVSAVVRDVTERKRFEQTLQEKNVELEKASMAKDRFLASMSHELRTPLNAIIGFTGTLLMRLPGPLTGPQDMQLKTIQSSSQQLLSLINDLLDLAKIESGKVELNPEPVVCQRVLEEVSKTIRVQAENKSLAFELIAPADDVIVRTDRRALSQIVINLATNAIKFTDTGGVIIRLDQRQEMGDLLTEVSVIDTGVGIRPEDQVKLFQAFEQVASRGMRPKEGTGLGLHLSQILAHMLDGHIAFSSKFGEGSTFTFTLRQSSEKDRGHRKSITSHPTLSHATALTVKE